MLIDHAKIFVKAGDGGNGAVSFHREKYVAKGGPDGGDGGHGGSIVFRADPGATTLLYFRDHRKFIARNGGNGSGDKFHGATAPDLTVSVPRGTLIRDASSGKILCDLSGDEPFICCRGGRGGFGNRHFATPTRQVPMFAKNGTKGEERELLLELKMLADVALVGLPSAGKSSLLSRISAAKPKIAPYPFTTLTPQLGVVTLGGEPAFIVADIPGLIDGAADGAGLGHDFLRHIERCRLLLQLVDVSGETGNDPIGDLTVIDRELSRYSPALAERPRIVVANKCDMLPDDADLSSFEQAVKERGFELIKISALTGDGLESLLRTVSARLKELPPIKVFESEVSREDEEKASDETTVRRENNTFYVEGKWLIDLMGRTNFDNYESLSYFQRILIKNGVIAVLEEHGCTDGNTVDIYGFEFDFVK